MATIKLGAIVTDIAGKIAGQSFGKGSNGFYLKNNGAMANKRTIAQLAQRTQTANLTRIWSEITQVERDGWNAGVVEYPYTNKVGEIKYLSGFNLFQKLNQQLLNVEEPINTNLPDYKQILNATIQFDSVSIGTFKISIDTNYSTVMNYQLYATPPLSKGIANPRKYFKKIGIFGSALSTGVLIEPYYSAVFGQLIVGSFVHFGLKVTTKATGLTSSDYSSIISTVVSA